MNTFCELKDTVLEALYGYTLRGFYSILEDCIPRTCFPSVASYCYDIPMAKACPASDMLLMCRNSVRCLFSCNDTLDMRTAQVKRGTEAREVQSRVKDILSSPYSPRQLGYPGEKIVDRELAKLALKRSPMAPWNHFWAIRIFMKKERSNSYTAFRLLHQYKILIWGYYFCWKNIQWIYRF